MNIIDKGIEKKLFRFDEDRNFVTYIHQNKKRNYNNPEEKVQLECKTGYCLINQLHMQQQELFLNIIPFTAPPGNKSFTFYTQKQDG